MVKNVCTFIMALLTSTSALAQVSADSMVTITDGIIVPLVNKDFVTPDYFQDNWYVGLYAGANITFGSDGSHAPLLKKLRRSFALTVGKEISPVSDLRLQFSYLRNAGVTDDRFNERAAILGWKGDYSYLNHRLFTFTTLSLNFDYLINFTNAILGFRENRWFYLKGLVGIGGSIASKYGNTQFGKFYNNSHAAQLDNMDKYDNRRRTLVDVRVGLTGTFILSRNWHLHAEGIVNFLDNSFDSNPQTNNTWDGHVDFLLGVSYHFKGKGGRKGGFYYAKNDIAFYKRRADAIDDIRDKTAKRIQEVEEMAPDTVDVNAHVMYTLIAFDGTSDEVDRLQQSNIYTTAYAWMKEPQSDIYITNSTAKDEPLFRKRAEAIGKILMERYDIPANKVLYCPDEKAIKPRGNYIVFIVND